MIKFSSHIFSTYRSLCILGLMLVCFSAEINAQNSVSAEVDSTSIKIGEQIRYKISVEANADDLVVFPEGETFSPLELVEASEVDTIQNNGYRLLREYFLTQFDSGKYVIPQQEVLISEQSYLTDSIQVEVRDVVVDTTKQKLYPIKPSVEVSGGFNIPAWVWWVLGILLLGALVAFLVIRRKKKKDGEMELAPYEQAMVELDNLDKSHLLENREIKQYYSQLSFSARKYLDRKIYDRGLESTTNELVLYLNSQKDQGSLKLTDEIIQDFEKILHRADLAKFANSKPDVITAKEDRSRTQKIIDALRISVPEPTEDELLMDEIYQEELAKKRKTKRIIIGIVAGVAVVVIGITALIATKGYTYVKDTYLGHPTKELLEGEWIRSEYGNPEVAITTPQVLKRGEIEMPPEVQEMMVGSEMFTYGSFLGNFYTALTTVKFKGEVQFDMEKAIDGIYTTLEAKGAKNIVMKQEEFSTINGAKGMKVFGTLDAVNPVTGQPLPNDYIILNFAEKGGFEQILVIYDQNDTYAEEIAQRIINSVELNKASN